MDGALGELMEDALGGIHIGLEGLVSVMGLLVGFGVWLMRLEGKVNAHEREIVRADTRTTNLEDNVLRRLSLIEKSLSRIEGRLSILDDNE